MLRTKPWLVMVIWRDTRELAKRQTSLLVEAVTHTSALEIAWHKMHARHDVACVLSTAIGGQCSKREEAA